MASHFLSRLSSILSPALRVNKSCFPLNNKAFNTPSIIKLGRKMSLRSCSTNSTNSNPDQKMYSVTFKLPSGETVTAKGPEGNTIYELVQDNDLDIDGFGACAGTLCCSTCHVIFKEEDYNKVSEPISEEESDVLEQAFGYTETSRMACQVCLNAELDGVVVKVPEEKADARDS